MTTASVILWLTSIYLGTCIGSVVVQQDEPFPWKAAGTCAGCVAVALGLQVWS